ncbi:MAG: molybdopterin converting factor subunit 1 [Hyphomicrobiaceae bacterium]
MTVTLRYFAWVRERAGRAEEQVELPADLETAADVIGWLKGRSPEFGHAFEKPEIVRIAIDQQHAQPSASIRGAREIAFFPPVTGG